MSSTRSKATDKDIKSQLARLGSEILRFRLVLFVLVIAGVYSFVTFRILTLGQSTPSNQAIEAQTTSKNIRVDTAIVKRLENLKDNSVNVQTLFNEARRNPFAE